MIVLVAMILGAALVVAGRFLERWVARQEAREFVRQFRVAAEEQARREAHYGRTFDGWAPPVQINNEEPTLRMRRTYDSHGRLLDD